MLAQVTFDSGLKHNSRWIVQEWPSCLNAPENEMYGSCNEHLAAMRARLYKHWECKYI
jgi:hypothetical protein